MYNSYLNVLKIQRKVVASPFLSHQSEHFHSQLTTECEERLIFQQKHFCSLFSLSKTKFYNLASKGAYIKLCVTLVFKSIVIKTLAKSGFKWDLNPASISATIEREHSFSIQGCSHRKRRIAVLVLHISPQNCLITKTTIFPYCENLLMRGAT